MVVLLQCPTCLGKGVVRETLYVQGITTTAGTGQACCKNCNGTGTVLTERDHETV